MTETVYDMTPDVDRFMYRGRVYVVVGDDRYYEDTAVIQDVQDKTLQRVFWTTKVTRCLNDPK